MYLSDFLMVTPKEAICPDKLANKYLIRNTLFQGAPTRTGEKNSTFPLKTTNVLGDEDINKRCQNDCLYKRCDSLFLRLRKEDGDRGRFLREQLPITESARGGRW